MPNQTDLIDRARAFATEKHAGQVRKYTGLPYITHPEAVAALVSTVTVSEAAIAAAWLHDVVEDCGVTHEEIYELFGPVVGLFVFYLSDKSTPADGNRSKRKAIDRLHIAEAPAGALTVKLADLIDNTRTIVEYDPGFAAVYLEEKALLLEVLTHGDERLLRQAKRQLTGAFVELRAKRMRT